SPGSIRPVVLDVTDAASVGHAREQVVEVLQGAPLAALINNAGIGLVAPMETVEVSALQTIWDVNVLGVVRLTQSFLPTMAAGSRLIILGSIGDRVTVPFGGPLTSSKWAVASIAEAFRLELAARGVLVTLIEPGSIRTDAVTKVESAAAATAAHLARTDAGLAERFRRAVAVAVANERRGSDPAVVANAISRVLDAHRPPTRVLVGKHARLMAAAAAVLPDPVLDPLRLRLFHQTAASLPREPARAATAAAS
ncbi:MAG: SDR family NAD(P)-dependent oxidoreductase, partial [Janthinobacterium lividum]